MQITGRGAKAFDEDMVLNFFKAGMGTKVTKAEAQEILSDTAHELRDQFEGERSSRGMTAMVNALKRTAKELAKSDNLTAGAKNAIAEFVSGDGSESLKHAIEDIKSEVAYNKRNYSAPSYSTSHGT